MSISNKNHIIIPVVVFLALKPIYLFDSGGLQLCDFFMAVAIVYDIITSKGKIEIHRDGGIYKLLMCLVLFQTIVNLVWFIFYHDTRLMYSSLFYIYNAVAFLYFVNCGFRYGATIFKKSCAYGVIISSAICLLGIVVNAGINVRGLGFFNNPNQLGLHGVLLLTILFFTGNYIRKIVAYSIIVVSLIIIFASASKAAFLAVIGLLLMFVLFYDRRATTGSKIRKVIILIIFAAVVYSFFYADNMLIPTNPTIMYMKRRILTMSSESDSNLAMGRGYARIKELGMNFIWGLGEGAYSRFSIMRDHEVHSTFANILVSYGMAGSIGFVLFWEKLFRNRPNTLLNICGFIGIILYSITHNSIRNTMVWLLFAVLFLNKYYYQSDSIGCKGHILNEE